MRVVMKNRPEGGYNGEEWPQVGEAIDLPEHVAESMLAAGDVVKPSSAEAREAKAEGAAREKVEQAREDAQAKIDAAEKAKADAEAAAEEKIETATAKVAKVETAVRKTTPKK